MGKKQGEAARVKGNVKPSSSAKAAEMLLQVPNYNFGSDMPPIGIGTLMEDSFDSNLDADFRMELKKLYKKDSLTKLKSLEELKSLIESKSQEDCISIISYWAKSYTKLTIDYDRRIRELCQQTHEKLCSKVNKHLAPYIKTIMPYWLLAQSDSYPVSSRIAENSFKSTFNDQKQSEVIYFCRDDILNTLNDYLLVQTAKTLSDMKNTTEDEALQKYENILSMSLKALALFIKYFFSSGSKFYSKETQKDCEKLEKLFAESKFWKYSKDQSMKVRSDFFYLLNQIIDTVLLNASLIDVEKNDESFKLKSFLRSKLVPLVFYACDEDNQACCFYVWSSIVKLINKSSLIDQNYQENKFWSLVNVKKAFIPKLISLLRSHANSNSNFQNIEIVYPALSVLLVQLLQIFDSNEEKCLFLKDFLSKIYESILNSTKSKFQYAKNGSVLVNSYFDCSQIVVENLKNEPLPNEILNNVLLVQFLALYENYLSNNLVIDSFENKFQTFLEKANQHGTFSKLIWTELSSVLFKTFKQADNEIQVLKNFSNLFKPLWKSNENLVSLVESLFEIYVKNFNETKQCLNNLNILARSFMSEHILDLFLNQIENYSSSQSLNEKLNLFNQKYILDLFKSSFEASQEEYLTEVIEFYLNISSSIDSESNTINNLDRFLFDLTKSDTIDKKLEFFIKNFVNKIKSDVLDVKLKSILIKWVLKSENLINFLNQSLLNSVNFYSNSKFAFDLIEILVKTDQECQRIDELMSKYLDKNLNYLKSISIKSVNLEEINQFLEFNSKLLFGNLLNENKLRKYLKLDTIWIYLLAYFNIDINMSLDLDQSVKKLVFYLFNFFSNEPNLYDELTKFIKDSLIEDNPNLNQILDRLSKEIRTIKGENYMLEFQQSVLLKQRFGFKKMYSSLLNPSNLDLLLKVYLHNRFSYLYPELCQNLIIKSKLDNQWLNSQTLNKINYSISQICSYENYQIDLFMDKNLLFSDWYFLLLTSILIDKFYTGHLEIKVLRQNLKNFISKSNFFQFLLNNFDSNEEFKQNFLNDIFSISENINQELNNLSFSLTYLVDKEVKNLERFSQNLMTSMIEAKPEFEDLIKIYLYDLPFAKKSVLDNLENLFENVDYYYDLFSGLLETSVQKLTYFISEIKQRESNLSENLKNFNFLLDLFIKYSNFYFELINSYDSDSVVYEIFNKNEKTFEFLKQTMSKYLLQVLDLFIDLKNSINSNLEYLFKSLNIDRSGGGYFFYFNFGFEKDSNLDLKWHQFMFIDKLNRFLDLFFINFKLDLTSVNYEQQMSQFLLDKHWDFILCYSSALSQKLNSEFSQDLDSKIYIQILSISFFNLLENLIKSIKTKVKDNQTNSYPSQILQDWDGFFNKEIFDPLLNSFVNLSQIYLNQSVFDSIQILLHKLGNVVSFVPFDRLLLNCLEPKLNVLDLDLDLNKKTLINLSNELKTVINHLLPNLKHPISSIQLNSYKILRCLMINISDYFINPENEEEENKANIIESLPHIIQETYFELTDLFSDLKKTVPFDQNILNLEHDEVEIKTHEANNKIMAYLLINKLILDMFLSNNLEFKVKLVNNLREINQSDFLIHCLFRLMPKYKFENSDENEELELDLDQENELTFKNEFVEKFACKLFKHALKNVPAMIRDWWNMQQKRVSDQVDKYTTKYVSPLLIEEEIKQINRSANFMISSNDLDEDQSSIKIKGMTSTREIVSVYKMKELSMELVIQLPLNYPLGVIKVSSIKRLGVSENEWRNWLLQLTTYLTHQNGSIIQGLQIWKRNVDKKFSGVEECTICYSVIHGTNYQLPKMKCRTCKHMFHSVCLYKWFESSSKSSCPLCRNLF